MNVIVFFPFLQKSFHTNLLKMYIDIFFFKKMTKNAAADWEFCLKFVIISLITHWIVTDRRLNAFDMHQWFHSICVHNIFELSLICFGKSLKWSPLCSINPLNACWVLQCIAFTNAGNSWYFFCVTHRIRNINREFGGVERKSPVSPLLEYYINLSSLNKMYCVSNRCDWLVYPTFEMKNSKQRKFTFIGLNRMNNS